MTWLATSLLVNAVLLLLLLRQCRRTGEEREQVVFWHERYTRLVELDERPILPFRPRSNAKERAWNGFHPSS